jgi:hemoglobin
MEKMMQTARGADLTAKDIDEARIEQLVRGFYARIRDDDRLGPIFAEKISDDEWEPHLRRMMDFWSSVMLTTGRYSGRPMPLHLALTAIVRPEDFDIWLRLFEETALSIGGEGFAAAFMEKARRVATSFKYAMFFDPREIAPVRNA